MMRKIELTEGYNGKKLTLEIPKDSSMDDMKEVFASMLQFLTFIPPFEFLETDE